MTITLYALARRYLGIHEIPGAQAHPLIAWWLSLCHAANQLDETAWCSAFVHGIAWELGLPRSGSLAARSWLAVGEPVSRDRAAVGWDVVVLKRGRAPQPGPEVQHAPGHVGIFVGWDDEEGTRVRVLGGNQSDQVSVAVFPAADILGIRRLSHEV